MKITKELEYFITNTTKDIVLELDLNYTIISYNCSFKKIFLYSSYKNNLKDYFYQKEKDENEIHPSFTNVCDTDIVNFFYSKEDNSIFSCYFYKKDNKILFIASPQNEPENFLIENISTLTMEMAELTRELKRKNQELEEINKNLEDIVHIKTKEAMEKERQLILQSKSAAMGDMMEAILHQWKQPLSIISVINSSVSLNAELENINNEYILEETNEIKKQIKNMSNVMEDFRNFFKPQDKIQYNVNDTINKTLNLLMNIYEQDSIIIKTTLTSKSHTSGYPNELIQVLINILNNARDAIVEGNIKNREILMDTTDINDY